MLYFAYGSNLSVAQMKQRCPSAKIVGRARLHGHRLAFAGWSSGWRGATATVVPTDKDARGSVPGVVYEIPDAEDVKRLDSFEGCPTIYTAHEVEVGIERRGRATVWVYVRRDPLEGAPSADYVRRIADGYRDHRLPVGVLMGAAHEAFRREVFGSKGPGPLLTRLAPVQARPAPAPDTSASAAPTWKTPSGEWTSSPREAVREERKAPKGPKGYKAPSSRPRFASDDENLLLGFRNTGTEW